MFAFYDCTLALHHLQKILMEKPVKTTVNVKHHARESITTAKVNTISYLESD